MFTAAVFAIADTWKQPPSAHQQTPGLRKCGVCVYVFLCVCVCGGISLSHKKELTTAICTNTGGPRDYYT